MDTDVALRENHVTRTSSVGVDWQVDDRGSKSMARVRKGASLSTKIVVQTGDCSVTTPGPSLCNQKYSQVSCEAHLSSLTITKRAHRYRDLRRLSHSVCNLKGEASLQGFDQWQSKRPADGEP